MLPSKEFLVRILAILVRILVRILVVLGSLGNPRNPSWPASSLARSLSQPASYLVSQVSQTPTPVMTPMNTQASPVMTLTSPATTLRSLMGDLANAMTGPASPA